MELVLYAFSGVEEVATSMPNRSVVLLMLFGMGRIRFLKNGYSDLQNSEANHGEDVHLDSASTHSYMKYLYKYLRGELRLEVSCELITKFGRGRAGQGRVSLQAGRQMPRTTRRGCVP